jgi:hypothetical protein
MDTPSDEMVAEGAMPVAVHAWGITAADVENAVYKAETAPTAARVGWRFGDVVRLNDATCPIDVRDPGALAAGEGYHWAFAVYPAGAAS